MGSDQLFGLLTAAFVGRSWEDADLSSCIYEELVAAVVVPYVR